jgi:endonuclease/exonuclease/phosphatase family metal-dependent hydrolase
MPAMPVRVLTWNLRGRDRPDLGAVAGHVSETGADVVVLQEVQRRQARVLAAALGWDLVWRLKHWPVVIPAEGLAILAQRRPWAAETVVLAGGWRFWSSRRRIALAATVATSEGPVRVVDVHLGAGVPEEERVRQAGLVTGLGEIVAGDLNARPGAPTLGVFGAAGLGDAWAEVGDGTGHTNWGGGARSDPAVKRLDYVLLGDGWRALEASVPAHDDADFPRFGAVSDHLPVTVTVARDDPGSAPAADHPTGPGAGG